MAEARRSFGRGIRVLRAARKRAGMEGVAMLLGARLLPRKLFFLHEVDVLALSAPLSRSLAALDGGYELAVAGASILEELVECTDSPLGVDERRRALARILGVDAATCFTVRRHGRLVAYLCAFAGKYVLTYDDYGPRTLSFALDPRAIFLGNAFIRPDYRMKGLFPHLLRYCTEHYPPGTRIFGHLDADNVHSFNSHRRLGFVPLLTVTCLSIGSACFFFQRPFGARRGTRVHAGTALRLVERGGVLTLAPEG